MDCDICSECGEHADYEESEDGETVSNCCGSSPYNVDHDYDMDR